MRKIRNLQHYIKESRDSGFRVSYLYSSVTKEVKEYLSLNECEYKVPNCNKKYRMSKENLEGIRIVRKDLPKIEKTIYVIRYNPYYLTYQYERYVYQKTYTDAQKVKIGLEKDKEGNLYICSPILTKDTSDEQVLMYLNLFKDFFGTFDICNPDFSEITKIELKREWDILEPGHRCFEKENLIHHIAEKTKTSVKEIEVKYGSLLKRKYGKIACGKSGFKGYYAFIYDDFRFVVMENFKEGNATYVFKRENWEEFSKLTKTEVMENKFYENRILHNDNWDNRIETLFESNLNELIKA